MTKKADNQRRCREAKKTALAVECPHCGVGIGVCCVAQSGMGQLQPHMPRVDAAVEGVEMAGDIFRHENLMKRLRAMGRN